MKLFFIIVSALVFFYFVLPWLLALLAATGCLDDVMRAKMKYTGKRTPDGALVRVEHERNATLLPLRTDLRNHSPTGFEWGYAGSGPAQLSLAICAHALKNDSRAQRVYQYFKARVVQNFRGDTWEITKEEVIQTVQKLEIELAAQRQQPQERQQ